MSGPDRCGHERSAYGWAAIESCPKSGFNRPPYLHPADKKSTTEPERCAFLDGLCQRPREDPSHLMEPGSEWFQNVAHHKYVPPMTERCVCGHPESTHEYPAGPCQARRVRISGIKERCGCPDFSPSEGKA
jgi:hypothetical protein